MQQQQHLSALSPRLAVAPPALLQAQSKLYFRESSLTQEEDDHSAQDGGQHKKKRRRRRAGVCLKASLLVVGGFLLLPDSLQDLLLNQVGRQGGRDRRLHGAHTHTDIED